MVPVIVIKDEPTVTTGGVSETTLPDPATIPQRSPQRKYMVYFPLFRRAWVLFLC